MKRNIRLNPEQDQGSQISRINFFEFYSKCKLLQMLIHSPTRIREGEVCVSMAGNSLIAKKSAIIPEIN